MFPLPHVAKMIITCLNKTSHKLKLHLQFFSQVSLATTFRGKGHIELHSPKNLEDMKAFTAVDLLLNLHLKNPSMADRRRKWRHDTRRDDSFFVFYLGLKDVSVPRDKNTSICHNKTINGQHKEYLIFAFLLRLLEITLGWQLEELC